MRPDGEGAGGQGRSELAEQGRAVGWPRESAPAPSPRRAGAPPVPPGRLTPHLRGAEGRAVGRARAGEQGGGEPQSREHGGGAVARAPTPARPDAARAGNGPRGRGLLAILFSRRNKRKSLAFHPAGSPGARGRTIRPLLPSSCRSSKERTPRSLGVLRDRSPEQKATLLLRRHHCSTTASRPRGRKPPAGSTSHPAGRRVRASARPPPAARPVAPRSHHRGGQEGGAPPSLSHLLEHPTLPTARAGGEGARHAAAWGAPAGGTRRPSGTASSPSSPASTTSSGCSGRPGERARGGGHLPTPCIHEQHLPSLPPPLKEGAPAG